MPHPKYGKLSELFLKEVGLTPREFFKLGTMIFAAAQKTGTFSIRALTEAQIEKAKDVLTEEKVRCFLKITKADYSIFREDDKRENANLDKLYTKTRSNPLLIHPIIEFDNKTQGDPFVIPNLPLFVKRVYPGMYWWFHDYFSRTSSWRDLNDYFGPVFQEYVGVILKNIYGESNVHGEIRFGNGLKFIDWWIEKNEKIYLFEAKAYQFSLPNRQMADKDTLIKTEIAKIADSIEQVFNRVQDIPNHKELEMFRGKKIIPVLVFMDMSLVSNYIFDPWLTEALTKLETDKSIKGLTDFKIPTLNIEELELYDGVADKMDLEEIFEAYRNDLKEGFLSVLAKAKGSRLSNTFLDEVYKDFWKEFGTPNV